MEIKNTNHLFKNDLKPSELFAIWITDRIGTIGFFLIIFIWTVLWLGWNMIAPKDVRFDPYPAFVLWLFISNMIQIFLMPLLMVGQNLQAKRAEIRAENDFNVNIKAEKEVALLIKELSELKKMVSQLSSK
ncbi:hypothetical protein C21_03778 [Arenibacter sp. NBRC 103722]|uniref:DUF1003 domain-containing protein n=1 Tax=unclassified Arenibacter TaxID=2615047 RepID=UPI0008529AC3|nr:MULTISPECIES: DUF1003 domain-containing protein [unclassified Arenibacter]MCM4164850.1 DUF1003 domain-containing protein [Arenibacter sp. A80]MDX1766435.1 DUF1003 domain-containing protein [Arenibacter troitsensis]RFT55266.1 DUF1003 domain-containing protein [Arenibacter sp. P308M17]GBF21592.1 hypothetical protein C21_03778 [Arenibacter sp. NBRC 103722]|tara:strand:- start:159 stop:551 length:393 start_codon:yes stop_codon:yes gene_type:complete